jgi:hypothetical protein
MRWQLRTAVLIAAAPAPGEDKKYDDEKTQGTWNILSFERGGKTERERKV